MSAPDSDPDPPVLSIGRLRAAFARMLSGPAGKATAPDPDAVTPEGIAEALLFVGSADGRPAPPERIAQAIGTNDLQEVDAVLQRLADAYAETGAPCVLERSPAGARFRVDPAVERIADRLSGRVRAARLSPAAVETLSVVAYRQPIEPSEVDRLRGASSAGALRLLKKHGLVTVAAEPPADALERLVTTDRFLRMMGLGSLSQLPRVAELDD